MANHYVREGSLGTASGTSFSNARSFYDIEDWAPSVAPGDSILFHTLDDFRVPGHGNSPFFRIELNGTKSARITLRGANPDSSPAAWHVRGDRMAVWDRNYRSVAQGKGLFDIDGDYVTIEGLQAHHMSWVFRSVGGDGAHLGWLMQYCHFEQITRILETKNGSDAAGVAYSTFKHITGTGHSKSLFKIQQDSRYVYFIDVHGDSQFQDGDNFSSGIQFDEDAHHGYVWGSSFRNIRDTLDDYWNGDGVSAESTNDFIEVDGCWFENITDGGVDFKAPNTTVKNSTFIRCKKSVRSWSPSLVVDNIKSFEPTLWGGTGENCHFWHEDGAGPIIVKNSLLVNRETKADVMVTSGDNGHTGSTGQLINCHIEQRADSNYLTTTSGGTLATVDTQTTRKLIDPVPEYGSITVGTPTTANNGVATTTAFTLDKANDVAGTDDLAVDDVLLCAVLVLGSGNMNGLTGFTNELEVFLGNGNDSKLYLWTKKVVGDEPSSYTLSHATSGRRMAAVMIPLRGVDASSIIAAIASATTGGSSSTTTTTHTGPSLPMTTSKAKVFQILGLRANTSATPDAATTELVDYASTGGLTIEIATEDWTGGLDTTPPRLRTSAVATRSLSISAAIRPLPA